jgi:hypothetical protein
MFKNGKDELKIFNVTTGEFSDSVYVEPKAGTQVSIRITTEEQREGYKQVLDFKDDLKNNITDFIARNEGAFVHLIFKYGQPIFKKLEEKAPGNKCNTHVIRFMMLATCLTFHGNLSVNGHRIKKSSLKDIWATSSRNSINETYDLLTECGYIYETEEGYLMMNEDIVIKGAVKDFEQLKKEDNNLTYTRVFVDNVKDMYEGTESKQRKQLANLFKILPYINFKYNVFCMNPEETDKKKLNLLNWTDLARLCGYDETHVTKFRKDLMNLKIYGYDVIGEFNRSSGKTIIVNPKIYYSGDDANDVKYLYDLFEMNPKK